MMFVKRVFEVSWRVALLTLPWQTRWMGEVPRMNGFPWEQGTVVVYVSWAPLLVAILSGLWLLLRARTSGIESGTDVRWPALDIVVAAALLVGAALFTSSGLPTLLFAIRISLLLAFGVVLLANRVLRHTLVTWLLVSLVPHAVLGIWQFTVQHTLGSTLIGVTPQHASDAGVSVIEFGDLRALRAYGGFPHPNILGGWLVMGLALLPERARQAKSNLHTLAVAACAALFMLALMLSFSRGAWVAALLAIPVATVLAWREAKQVADRQAIGMAVVSMLLMIGMVAIVHRDLVMARFTPTERLERWSLEQRASAIKDGVSAWQKRPLVGWGPGAGLVGISSVRPTSLVPLEPPHLVPLAVLLEVGLIGFIACLVFLWRVLLKLLTCGQLVRSLPLILATVALLGTDHYLWTLWAGQTLAAFVIIALLLPTRTHVTSGIC